MIKILSSFQKWVASLLALALLINFCILIILLAALNITKKRLNNLGDTLEQTAQQHIITEIKLDENIQLNTNVYVSDEISVGIQLVLETMIPFKAEIPVNENIMVPIRIGVKDYIKLDTIIQASGTFLIDVDDTIPLDQKVKVLVLGKNGLNLPVQGNIKLKQSLKTEFDELVPVKGLIPVDMLIVDTLHVGVNPEN